MTRPAGKLCRRNAACMLPETIEPPLAADDPMTLPSPSFTLPLPLAALAATLLAVSAPAARAAPDACIVQGATIIESAYPTAARSADGTFDVDGATIRLPEQDDSDAHAVVCRTWPSQPALTLVAVPLMTRQADDGNEGDIELLVVDSKKATVRQRLRLPGLMTDDALYVSSVALDTAFYRLASRKIAFGLRLSLQGSSRPNPFGETTLWLFLVDDGKLRPVLDNIVVSSNRGEWDTNCAGEFENTERTLSMEPSPQSAIADIVVSETTTTTVNVAGKDGACLDTETAAMATHRLRYDASVYRVPKALSRME